MVGLDIWDFGFRIFMALVMSVFMHGHFGNQDIGIGFCIYYRGLIFSMYYLYGDLLYHDQCGMQ
ncbi:hypothetical protein BDD12DRAFT_835859 [Trichophaea hybrida]|nr:hypothetical protein BDD12DRAFT_835859 [Trichophaea hybrida]